MIGILVRKLLRDVWVALLVVSLLLFAFEALWAHVTRRIVEDVVGPLIQQFGGPAVLDFVRTQIFSGSGRLLQAIIGGDTIRIEQAGDLMSVGYVHPLVETILCIWAVGRASGAIAGELDRGTMELLLAQPLPRWELIAAHFSVDVIVIPVLCLSMWAGVWTGCWLSGLLDHPQAHLRVDPWRFGPALLNTGLLVFAVSGYTLLLSSWGRFRGRVMGLAILAGLVMFLLNVIGQLWDTIGWVRPWTVFYYYQPQLIILNQNWWQRWEIWQHLGVLLAVGAVGYLVAVEHFNRRDLPAPL